nr:MAG TPA: hypothetical protein [Caudoviricetes sp.]
MNKSRRCKYRRCQFCSIFNPRTEKQVCDDWALVDNSKREMYCEIATTLMLKELNRSANIALMIRRSEKHTNYK